MEIQAQSVLKRFREPMNTLVGRQCRKAAGTPETSFPAQNRTSQPDAVECVLRVKNYGEKIKKKCKRQAGEILSGLSVQEPSRLRDYPPAQVQKTAAS